MAVRCKSVSTSQLVGQLPAHYVPQWLAEREIGALLNFDSAEKMPYAIGMKAGSPFCINRALGRLDESPSTDERLHTCTIMAGKLNELINARVAMYFRRAIRRWLHGTEYRNIYYTICSDFVKDSRGGDRYVPSIA